MTVFAFWFDSNKEQHYPFLGTRVIRGSRFKKMLFTTRVNFYIGPTIVVPDSSYSNMAEGVGSVVDSENGSFQNQITRRLPRKAIQAVISAWKPLCAKKSPRGDPRAGLGE